MNAKAIGLTAIFTALTIALSQFRIPAPYPLGFTYKLFQIPIVVAFLFLGPRYGVTIAFLNMIAVEAISGSETAFIGPPYALLITLTMLLGVYISSKYFARKTGSSEGIFDAKPAALSTAIGVISRALILLPVDYVFLSTVWSIGSGMSMAEANAYVIAIMPGIILFNITIPLYVIPISYYVAKKLSKSFKIGKQIFS
jgi:riboflavin transporter FmnP